MNEETLERRLAAWEIDLPDDPGFRASVWREVAMREATSPANRIRQVLDRLVRPKVAIPVSVAAFAVVILTASLHGLQSRQQLWDDLAMAYSSAIDPVLHVDAPESDVQYGFKSRRR